MSATQTTIAGHFTLPEAVRDAWRPRERLSVHRWADRYRRLQREYSAEPGNWRTRRVPYLAEIMDAFVDPQVDFINFVKSARLGGTEAVNNMIAYAIDQEPGPMLIVYPTESDLKEEFRDRLVPLIKGSQRLRRHIPAEGWDARRDLQLDTCKIYGAWATSQTTLLRRTCRYVFFDELDNCDRQTGVLGSTLKLGLKRLATYRERATAVAVTTPSTPDASAWQQWLASDRRRYHVPCPLCGVYQELVFDRIRVPADQRDPDAIARGRLAWYRCAGCEGRLNWHLHQAWMVARGVWVREGRKIVETLPVGRGRIAARAAFDHPQRWLPAVEGDPPARRIAGFHLWAAYSPWVSWSDIMAAWFETKDDREQRIVFRQQVLGLPWEEVVHSIDHTLFRRRVAAGLPRRKVPADARIITAGVDVQEGRIYYVVRAWGLLCESWLIDHSCIWVMDDSKTVLAALEDFYQEVFADRPYGGRAPSIALIDAGYRTRDVYDFCQRHPGCLACKGEDTLLNHLVRRGRIEPQRGRRTERHPALQLWLVNTNACKDTLHAWSAGDDGGPRSMHLHAEVDDDYCAQFTAEHKIYDARTRRNVWRTKTPGRANHYLDCEVYDLAAAELVRALALRPKAVGEARSGGRRRGLPETSRRAREVLGLRR